MNAEARRTQRRSGAGKTAPGTYLISGLYEERARRSGEGEPALWGGVVRSNTIRVEVK